METKTYNGWTNYETWAVKLWIDNEYGDYLFWQERAQELRESESTSKHWTQEESARYGLADELKQWVNENNPLAESASMFSDLLGAAISEVNWDEIAQAMLDDLE